MKKSRILKIWLLLALASMLGACAHDVYRQDYYSYRPYKAPTTVPTDVAGSPTTLTPDVHYSNGPSTAGALGPDPMDKKTYSPKGPAPVRRKAKKRR